MSKYFDKKLANKCYSMKPLVTEEKGKLVIAYYDKEENEIGRSEHKGTILEYFREAFKVLNEILKKNMKPSEWLMEDFPESEVEE